MDRGVAEQPLLSMSGIVKSYGAVKAVRGASLEVKRPGTVHTLMGQNGCGKSTMLGMLSGQLRPDAGDLQVNGVSLHLNDAAQAVRQGIVMVAQETALAEDLSVTENILLGRLERGRTGISWTASHAKARTILQSLGLNYDPRVLVRSLPPDQRQLVEIARAISSDARVVILDEPTSSLTDDQVTHLFATIRKLTSEGVSVLFVSHRLPEVFAISDDVTIMRDGVTVSTGPIDSYTPESLVELMIGESMSLQSRSRLVDDSEPAAPMLTVSELTQEPAFRDVTFDVSPGQIIGIAGLSGSGSSEVLETIFGVREPDGGTIAIDETPLTVSGPRDAIASGIGYVPPDRKTDGLLLDMPGTENMLMAATHTHSRLRAVPRRHEQSVAGTIADRIRLVRAGLQRPPRTLSGGNQQKVLLGKWLAIQPRVLMLDEPTRGVDIAAKREIHSLVLDLAADGLALVVTSSEVPELIEICDEILVMFRGRIVARLRGEEITEAKIAELAGGHI
jgi:ABC-type sugar transport system ATPase subunit